MLFSNLSVRTAALVVRTAALGLAACLASALPAAALPVDVYADGTTDFGFDPADVAAAIGAGASDPTEVEGLDDGSPWLTITTPDGIPATQGKNKQNPSRGSSIWTLHIGANAPADALENLALVILGHDPNDPISKYKTENVGLTIDTELPWLFVTPGSGITTTGATGGGSVYVAYLLGDLEAGVDYEVPIEYLVGQKLKKTKNELGEKVFMFPRYAYAVVSNVPVPEPSALALLALGALVAGAARRRAR
jgi:hypothetical protein